MGVWIEINALFISTSHVGVTPCVGVWIEMYNHVSQSPFIKSLPVWECGLKLRYFKFLDMMEIVTPCVGVWIEIGKV